MSFLRATLIGVLVLGAVIAPKAHAQFAVVETGYNLVTNTITTVKNIESGIREYVLDNIAYQLAETALDVMTSDIVAWINSGFQGSPAFIQDPGDFLRNIADYTAGQFLDELGGGFLCSPFSADIQFAIEIGYYQSGTSSELEDQYACRFTDAIENVEAFLENDLSRGGLRQFFEVSVVPQNNPYLATVDLNLELDTRLANRVNEEQSLLDWGNGFLSFRECEDGQEYPNCQGDILTPGDVIQNQLNESLTIGGQRLVVADEINEIVSALMTQLVRQAIGGAGGLLGATNSAGGNSSLVDRTNDPDLTGSIEELEDRITADIRSGNQAQGAYNRERSRIQQALNIISGSTCTDPELSQIRGELLIQDNDAQSDIADVADKLLGLNDLLQDIQGSTTRSEYTAAAQRYQALQPTPNEADVVRAEGNIQRVNERITRINEIIDSCEV